MRSSTVTRRALSSLAWLSLLAVAAPALAEPVPHGAYLESDFGPLSMFCNPPSCLGVYEDGQSFIYLGHAGTEGTYAGTWTEPDADRLCDETADFPHISTRAWGPVTMQFDSTADSWTGRWGYCSDEASRAFNGHRTSGRGAPPEPVGGDASVSFRLFGSWLPTPDSAARRNDMYTFNPDGTRTVSDGSGMNAVDTWRLQGGQLFLDDRPVDLDFLGYNIMLSGVEMEHATLWGETYEGQSTDLGGIDPQGIFAPVGDQPITVGDYGLHLLVLGTTEDFRAHQSGTPGMIPPILVQFWNENEPIKRAENGNAYRNDVIDFEPHSYSITDQSLKFYGRHPEWGEIFFNGTFNAGLSSQGPGPEPVIDGDLLVKGHIFRDIQFMNQGLD